MGHAAISQFAGYQGYKSHMCDKDTLKPIGTIFVFQEDSATFARFIQFNDMLGGWFFSELPPPFAEDETVLIDLIAQLKKEDITFLLHPNEISTSPGSPPYVQ